MGERDRVVVPWLEPESGHAQLWVVGRPLPQQDGLAGAGRGDDQAEPTGGDPVQSSQQARASHLGPRQRLVDRVPVPR